MGARIERTRDAGWVQIAVLYEEPKCTKTRTWFGVNDKPVVAGAGLWRVRLLNGSKPQTSVDGQLFELGTEAHGGFQQ